MRHPYSYADNIYVAKYSAHNLHYPGYLHYENQSNYQAQ